MDNKQVTFNVEDANRLYKIVAILFGFVLVTSTVFFHLVEHWNWLDSLYFTVVTMATVGYGDFVPTTPLGKIGAMILIVVGIGLFGAFVSQFLKRGVVKRQEKRIAKRKQQE